MMHGQTTEQQCNFPAMPDGTGRGGFHARADVEPSCTTMKRQALETNRLSRSNSFGSLGGLINFFSRIGRDEVDSDSSSQCAKLMKKNAYLEQRLVNASSRIAELESELQLHATFARRMSSSKQKIAGLEETNRTLQRQLTGSRINPASTSSASSTTSARAVPDIGTDLELSIMRRRVQDLERQNRMLRSELVGAGRELDEHRQPSSSLDIMSSATTDAAASSQQIIDDVNSMHSAHQDTDNVAGWRSSRRLATADEVHIYRLGSMASALTTQTDATDSSPLSEVLGH